MGNFRNWLYQLVRPRATEEDRARKEFILNVLLGGSVVLIFFTTILSAIHQLVAADQVSFRHNSLSFVFLFIVLVFFLFLYFLSRRGFLSVASSLLLVGYLILAAFMGYKWGVDLHAEILLFVLVIVMAGILINARAAFLLTLGITFFLFGLNYLQRSNFIITSRYWRTNMWGPVEVFVTVLIFGVIAAVSWLSNREIAKALERARYSEGELKRERDLLEVKVEERTQALKVAQIEKMAQLYRFAEFGRLSSGLFHDLTNHLSAVSLSVEQMQIQTDNLGQATTSLVQARKVSDKMKEFVAAIRKQIVGEQNFSTFCLNEEINETLQLLSYKARQYDVDLELAAPQPIFITGDRIKFNQIIVNLIANAIDAYADSVSASDRRVLIILDHAQTGIFLVITDWAIGIPESLRIKIFEPFFTTKTFSRGIGLGLSVTKRIVEKDFGGSISVESREGFYTTFRITFPLTHYVQSSTITASPSVSQTTATD